ncbi:hypothetical protein D3C86_2258460 [compost metagenome]
MSSSHAGARHASPPDGDSPNPGAARATFTVTAGAVEAARRPVAASYQLTGTAGKVWRPLSSNT